MLTHHRLKNNLGIIRRVFHCREVSLFMLILWISIRRIITVNSNPMHLTASGYFEFAHHRYIVFCCAGNNAGTTTNAGVQINGHSPLMISYVMIIPQVNFFGSLLCLLVAYFHCKQFFFIAGFRLLQIFCKKSFSYWCTPHHRMMSLRGG